MTSKELIAVLVGVAVTAILRIIADRFPGSDERRRRYLERRIMAKELEKLEKDEHDDRED